MPAKRLESLRSCTSCTPGTAHFQPSVSDIKGSIYVNFDKSGAYYSKSCKKENCEFNYLEDNKRLFDLNHGKHTITVRAIGGGATGSTTEAFTVDNMPVISIEEPESGLVFVWVDIADAIEVRILNEWGQILGISRVNAGKWVTVHDELTSKLADPLANRNE